LLTTGFVSQTAAMLRPVAMSFLVNGVRVVIDRRIEIPSRATTGDRRVGDATEKAWKVRP
jgi:hypothetical protein